MLRGNYGNYKSETLDLFKITECRIYTLESQDAEAGMVTLIPCTGNRRKQDRRFTGYIYKKIIIRKAISSDPQ